MIISSFSGGKTSAHMTIELKKKYPDLVVLFANTGQENNETLDFINQCDIDFNLNVVWLEAVINYEKNKGTTYKVVDYKTSHRGTDIFEEMIKKYGIPNKAYPHCTRELKLIPIEKWIKKNINIEYKVAVGIRIDEAERASKKAEENNLFYPLIENCITKYEINHYWREKSFNLNLEDYQGNCKTCWKKSNKKLLMIAKDKPEFFDFNLNMEKLYGLAGHNIDGTKRVFFRNNISTIKLLSMVDKVQMDILDFIKTIDPDSPCEESCEAFV